MKICFLINKEDNHSMRWVEYFRNNGHEIHLVEVKRGHSKLFEILRNIISVRNQVKKINPDILHVHYAGVNGALGALSGFHPFILTVHGSDVLIVAKSKIAEPIVRFVLKKADLITCGAEHMRKAMIKLGADYSKIKIIYFGVDIQKFSPGPKKISDSELVISLRNLEPVYDVETFVKAIPLIIKEVAETNFIIAGQGPEKEKLEKLADSLKVSHRIKFVGWISSEKLLAYLRASDVYVSTSLSDGGLSQCTSQAMACEVPVITTDLEVNREWIIDGVNGLIVSSKNPAELAEKIIMLIKDKDFRIRLGKKAREMVKENLDYKTEMKKVENIYKIII